MKVGLISLGCPKNLVDGEVMLGLAQQAGHQVTSEAADADVLVVNTCAFIDRAKQESIDTILEMAAMKRPGTRLVVTGCLAERYRDELKREIPEIDALLGTGEVDGIVDALGGTPAPQTTPLTLYRKPTYLYDASTPRLQTTPRHFAYVKIAEGCDYTCAFCIIPTLRGGYRSRTAESVVEEARRLADRGVRELLLISQDTTFYGIDRGQRGALARLLRELNAIDGLSWIRLLYLYPTTITDDVLDAMAECEKVCRYVDLPLQHASAGVLKRMRRPGNRRTYDALLSRVRARVPGVALRTTFIVGFPGETEAEFAELERFVDDVRFDHIGVFTYSHEEGTRAFAHANDVPAAEKRRRRARLMRRQQQLVAAAREQRMGSIVRVMVDGASPEHELVFRGRLEGQAPEIDPVVYLSGVDPDIHRPGELIEARITGAQGYDLIAEPVPPLVTV